MAKGDIRWTAVLRLLERELVWFSILVPILAVFAFVCGGICALWQWWASAAFVAVCGFCRRDRREALLAGGVFLLWLCAVWVLCGVLANPGGWDENAYHFPAVRLLAAGWNPLATRTPEAFRDAFGFVQGDMEVYHALFQMKGVWLFDAVALKFTGEFFSPMMPLTLVLFPAVAIRICMETERAVWRAVAVVILYFLIPRSFFSLDAALVLAIVGMMACMCGVVRGKRPDVLSLAGYTTWAVASKLNGSAQAFLLWAVFGAVVLARGLPLKRLFAAAGIAFLAFLPLAITPFATGAVDYGHPLYPHCSNDAGHPAVDICADFEWKRNDDIKSLGHVGALVNAYVSPSPVRAVRRHVVGEKDFLPKNQMFTHYPGLSGDDGVTAVHGSVRLAFWMAVAFLCLAGGWSGGMVAAMAVLGLVAVPTRMIGYVRYVPWAMAPLLFSAAVASRMPPRAQRVALAAIVGVLFLVRPLSLQRQVLDTALDIYSGSLAREFLESGSAPPPKTLFPPQSQRWRASLALTRREFPVLASAALQDRWGEDLLATPEWLSIFPCGLFGFDGESDFKELASRLSSDGPGDSKLRKAGFVARIFLKTVPALVLRRCTGRCSKGERQ